MKEGRFITLNFINWEDHIYDGLILLDFWAEWCTACVAQDKYYDELLVKYSDKLKIGKIHVGDNRVLSDKFGVRNVPYLILMNKGNEIARMPGIQSKEYLMGLIEKEIE
jgi:thioredoxin 1